MFSHSSQRISEFTKTCSSQNYHSRFEGGSGAHFTPLQPKNTISMKGSRPFLDGGHDACLSQATTSIVDASAPGGDDSFRKHQRGSQGSIGNFSQDKLSFTGSDTIDMMGSFIYVI